MAAKVSVREGGSGDASLATGGSMMELGEAASLLGELSRLGSRGRVATLLWSGTTRGA